MYINKQIYVCKYTQKIISILVLKHNRQTEKARESAGKRCFKVCKLVLADFYQS